MRIINLEEIADIGMDIISDLLSDEAIDSLDGDTLKIIEKLYGSSDCDNFAVALHRITGWPIVGLSSVDVGPVHRCVQNPEGLMVDVFGETTRADMVKRYSIKTAIWSGPGGEELALGSTVDDELSDFEMAVSTISQLPYAPFDGEVFKADVLVFVQSLAEDNAAFHS